MAAAERLDFHGLEAVRWTGPDGASAVAVAQGAHLVSWTPASGAEALFVSERSAFAPGRAIRGGIPVCFPQFAERGPLVKHGFARTLSWRFLGVEETAGGMQAAFSLESSAATLAAWPHRFALELRATIGGRRLDVELAVDNTGERPFAFTSALHTYFQVADARSARLSGLPGVHVPIDRVYRAAPPVLHLEDASRVLRIEQRGFADTVVWNPGAEGAIAMPDMGPDGWLRMLCVEAAAVEPPVVLAPGKRWTGTQSVEAALPGG